MKVIYSIKDRVCDELETLDNKQSWTPSDVEIVGELIDILKDIATIEAMHDGGYSSEYIDDPSWYIRKHSYRSMPRRDSMGRFTSRDNDPGQVSMVDELRDMMRDAKTDHERDIIRHTIEQLERL